MCKDGFYDNQYGACESNEILEKIENFKIWGALAYKFLTRIRDFSLEERIELVNYLDTFDSADLDALDAQNWFETNLDLDLAESFSTLRFLFEIISTFEQTLKFDFSVGFSTIEDARFVEMEKFLERTNFFELTSDDLNSDLMESFATYFSFEESEHIIFTEIFSANSQSIMMTLDDVMQNLNVVQNIIIDYIFFNLGDLSDNEKINIALGITRVDLENVLFGDFMTYFSDFNFVSDEVLNGKISALSESENFASIDILVGAIQGAQLEDSEFNIETANFTVFKNYSQVKTLTYNNNSKH